MTRPCPAKLKILQSASGTGSKFGLLASVVLSLRIWCAILLAFVVALPVYPERMLPPAPTCDGKLVIVDWQPKSKADRVMDLSIRTLQGLVNRKNPTSGLVWKTTWKSGLVAEKVHGNGHSNTSAGQALCKGVL
ncbi:MAG: hypothetical protein ACPL7O_00415, partial [Armatimonadota bacterium]